MYKMASMQRLGFTWLGTCYMCSVEDMRVLYMCSEASNDHNLYSILNAHVRQSDSLEYQFTLVDRCRRREKVKQHLSALKGGLVL